MKKILVTNNNLAKVTEYLYTQDQLGLDTETYGVRYEDNMFALQIASGEHAFYFNMHNYEYDTYGEIYVWETHELMAALKPLFNKNTTTWFIHNAKFDLHRLANADTFLSGRVHCTQVVERILYNQHMRYSLDACLRRRKKRKNDRVAKYLGKHKCHTNIEVEGKKRKVKLMHFEQAPFGMMFKYGCDDASDVLSLGQDQLEHLDGREWDLYDNECKLVHTCLRMERRGVMIDEEYTKKGMHYEKGCLEDAIAEATEVSGEVFKNGPKWLRSAFDKHGQEYDLHPKTGNPIFDKEALGKMQSPIAELVREIRTREKYVGTYYSSFLHYRDSDGAIRANIKTAGTDTSRFSYSDPNLQNVPKEEDFIKGQIQVRKCFVPRPDHCFVMIDFDQQEFRLMLDYAGETELINNILENGLCVHQATADMVGIERKPAKTLNFGLLYGMGKDKLAKALKIALAEADSLKKKYFYKLPKVKRLIRDIINVAERRGYITTWSGRKLYFPDPEHAYKAPNHLIQGGCGDIARYAMPRLDERLGLCDSSHMLIQVHDEIVFEIHKNELDVIDDLKKIMEDVYKPINGMKLTCGVEHSWVSWGKQDVMEGYPKWEETLEK